MTTEETVDVIHLIGAAYPSFKPNNIKETIKIWQLVLSDVPYKMVEVALTMYIRTNHSGFAPVPGDIINELNKIKEFANEELTGMEAWAIVRRAILNATYNSVEEYNKLPELIQRAVGSPSQLFTWATEPNTNESVAQSHFLRTYDILLKRQNELGKMPENVRNLIGDMRNDNARLGDKGILQIGERPSGTD